MTKYDIIYIDPPWAYNRTVGHGCDTKYKRMTDADIYNLPILDISNKDCALLCWMTFPKLSEGIKAIESWGFKSITVFANWIKLNVNNRDNVIDKNNRPFFGVGTYPKSNGEILMLCGRGDVPSLLPPRKSNIDSSYIGKIRDDSISSILLHSRLRHSEKPNEARERIEKIFNDGYKKIEIFARHRVDGWDSIGYGVDGLDILESLKLIQEDKYKKEDYICGVDDI